MARRSESTPKSPHNPPYEGGSHFDAEALAKDNNEWVDLPGYTWNSRTYAPDRLEAFFGKVRIKMKRKPRSKTWVADPIKNDIFNSVSKGPSRCSPKYLFNIWRPRFAAVEEGVLYIFQSQRDLDQRLYAKAEFPGIDLGKCKMKAHRIKELVQIVTSDEDHFDYTIQAWEEFRTADWEIHLHNGMAYRQYKAEREAAGVGANSVKDVSLAVREAVDLMERKEEEARRFLVVATHPRILAAFRKNSRYKITKRALEVAHAMRQANEALTMQTRQCVFSEGTMLHRYVMEDLLKLKDDRPRATDGGDAPPSANAMQNVDSEKEKVVSDDITTFNLQHYVDQSKADAKPAAVQPKCAQGAEEDSYSLTTCELDEDGDTGGGDDHRTPTPHTMKEPDVTKTASPSDKKRKTPPVPADDKALDATAPADDEDDMWLSSYDERATQQERKQRERKQKRRESRRRKRGGKTVGDANSTDSTDDITN